MEEIEFVAVTDENLINAICQLADEVWREHYLPILGLVQVEYMLDKFQSKRAITSQIEEGYLYYLLKSPAGWVGYLGLVVREDELFLSKLYIVRRHRGKGFGRQSIDFIETMAKTRGLPKISLLVNKHNASSLEAYRKFGFSLVNSVIQDIGNGFVMDDYLMEKRVS